MANSYDYFTGELLDLNFQGCLCPRGPRLLTRGREFYICPFARGGRDLPAAAASGRAATCMPRSICPTK